jgi:hypothetical protein
VNTLYCGNWRFTKSDSDAIYFIAAAAIPYETVGKIQTTTER